MKTNDPKPPAVEYRGTKLSFGVVIIIVLFTLGLLSALARMIVSVIGAAFDLAVPAGQALWTSFKWLGLALLGLLLFLLLIGVFELAVQRWRDRRRQDLVQRASVLPRNETVRGAPPSSELDRVTAEPVLHYLQAQARDPATLTDRELALLRPHFPQWFARPEYAAQINAAVVVPLFELLIKGSSELEQQLQHYGEVAQRKPFWLARRTLHGITWGRAGLSAEQAWQRPSVTELKADFFRFERWFWSYGWPLVGWLEKELDARANTTAKAASSTLEAQAPDQHELSEAPDPEHRHEEADRSPDPLHGSEPADDDPDHHLAIARDLVEGARTAEKANEPWADPACHIASLEAAAREALAWDPESVEAQGLLDDVQFMWRRLRQFEARFPEWMDGEPWPPVMEAAFHAAADEPTPQTVKGHAARLYLTHRGDPAFLDVPRAPKAEDVEEAPLQPPRSSPPSEPLASPHLTLIQSFEPSATERAETLF